MKIIHILVGKANPNTMNGVNKVVHNLATQQAISGIDVEVWGISNSPEIISHEHLYKLKVFKVRKFRFSLNQYLKKQLTNMPRGTWVHLHSVFIPEYLTISHILTKNQVKYGLTPHGGYALQNVYGKLHKIIYLKLLERIIVVNAEFIHVIGKSEVKELTKLFGKLTTYLIPNGQDLNDIYCSITKQNGIERPIFGYCGRLDLNVKGLDILLSGFYEYKCLGGKGILQIIGEGKDLNKLKSFVKRNKLESSVEFLGARFGLEKIHLICNMDVFIHTSRRDVIPTGCLEAASLQVPIIVSKETNLEDYIAKWRAGFCLEENTPSELLKVFLNFEKLFQKEADYERLRFNSRKMVVEEFDWVDISEKFNKIVGLCLNRASKNI